MEESASFCTACGAAVTPTVPPSPPPYAPAPGYNPAPAASMQENVIGMCCYITIIPAIVFLLVEPYKNSVFVRFHAFQCIFLSVAAFALGILLSGVFLGSALMGGGIGWPHFALLFVGGLIRLAMLVLWIVCLIKAYHREMWRIPVIGDLAAHQAGLPS
jgi:uncharacterized membrane protein